MLSRLNNTARLLTSSAVLALMLATAPQAFAATPADTLVIAWAIDDVITLDPAEAFEITMGEINGNTYDKLVSLDISDTSNVKPDIAESWTVSDDGKTFTFKIKPDLKFASGNPITAKDVAYSFERAVKLNKNPAFILQQFGLTGDNVADMAKATDDMTFSFTTDKAYAPSFVLNCLTATVGSIVDSVLVKEHEEPVTASDEYKFDTDFGNGWMKTHYAGSGPFKIRDWRANEVLVLERNENYAGEKPGLQRVIYRHIPESSAERLALENGDVDIARKLAPQDIDAVSKEDGIATDSAPKGTVYYISMNQKNETLAKPEVLEAMKYLIDYDAIGSTLIKDIGTIHQTFLPSGMFGALDENPYKLDVAKAKELLAKAGVPDGFSVTMDVRNVQPVSAVAESIQQSFAQAGIKLELIPGDGKQTLTKYRARNHDIYIGQWGTDYWDPNSNADTFASNPDNSDDTKTKTLSWRNAWDRPELTKESADALLEKDTTKRGDMYKDLQKKVLEEGPFAVMWQETEVAAFRKSVKGYKLGPTFDTNLLAPVTKE
ncbi:ABC transporter substrate-binding protein [Rhizobium halophytocola]|uniref:Peptide/nickel transport system substrate-binding protein n=1 Tax=Rhizobium halophytocola TaxID=735519 RepID=A0ABS4DTM5_9HYPH|nr:ABC transporter substrate-binding protein [Rhizobium halophytocola]MBP1849056.1 peptide/nickel transport system substrate-binding protein [Rhizobium halophytocola]